MERQGTINKNRHKKNVKIVVGGNVFQLITV